MKKFSSDKQRLIDKVRDLDGKEAKISDDLAIALIKDLMQDDAPELIMSSNNFNEFWREHVDKMAVLKNVDFNGKVKSIKRNLDYAAIGVLDKNDLYGEAYLAFLEAYSKLDQKKINEADEPAAMAWTYIKNTMKLNLDLALRNKRDGIKVTQWAIFQKKDAMKTNFNSITALFSKLDDLVFNNIEEVATTKYETDFIGKKLDAIIDRVLDTHANSKSMARIVVKGLFGINSPVKTYAELEEEHGISKSTLASVKKRAMKKLKTPEVMEEISYYMNEYKIATNSNAREYVNDNKK